MLGAKTLVPAKPQHLTNGDRAQVVIAFHFRLYRLA
jgi:hypothetical protein